MLASPRIDSMYCQLRIILWHMAVFHNIMFLAVFSKNMPWTILHITKGGGNCVKEKLMDFVPACQCYLKSCIVTKIFVPYFSFKIIFILVTSSFSINILTIAYRNVFVHLMLSGTENNSFKKIKFLFFMFVCTWKRQLKRKWEFTIV